MAASSATLKKYARLDKLEREFEAKLEKVKASRKEAEPAVIEYFEKMGMDRASIDGITIYIKRDLWAGRVDGTNALVLKSAFDEAGMPEYCEPKLNHQSFSAFVREIEKQNLPEGTKHLAPEEIVKLLPAPLQAVVKVSETFKVNTRKG